MKIVGMQTRIQSPKAPEDHLAKGSLLSLDLTCIHFCTKQAEGWKLERQFVCFYSRLHNSVFFGHDVTSHLIKHSFPLLSPDDSR